MMQTIGQFNDSYPPIIDGVAITVQQYARCLHNKGEQVCVVTPKAPDYIDQDPFPVYRYPSVPLKNREPYRLGLPDIDLTFQSKLENIPFSLVHAHCPFTSGLLALKIARDRKIPLVASFHSKYRDNFEQSLHSKAIIKLMLLELVYFYNQADEVWIPQEAVEDTLREYGYKGKVVVMNNGNDFSTDTEPELLQKIARLKLRIPEDELVFLYVGQLVWEKNLRLILEGLAQCNQPFRMYFVGTGYAAEDMKALASKLNISDKVFFTGMISDRAVLRDYYAAADLFLFPSLYDTWALVAREAAALYTPSVMVRGATAASQLIDNYNGFLVYDNPVSLALKLKELALRPELLRRTGLQAARTLTKSWEQIAEEVLERYQQLIKMKRK
jgi:glycosyltransferase involved in cell wall biosynthesis